MRKTNLSRLTSGCTGWRKRYCSPNIDENHNGVVLQFHGCYWHGCPRCYRINRDELLSDGQSMDDRYEKTCATTEKIKTGHYDIIEKWECDFNRELTLNEEMKQFFAEIEELIKRKPLDPRDAFLEAVLAIP